MGVCPGGTSCCLVETPPVGMQAASTGVILSYTGAPMLGPKTYQVKKHNGFSARALCSFKNSIHAFICVTSPDTIKRASQEITFL